MSKAEKIIRELRRRGNEHRSFQQPGFQASLDAGGAVSDTLGEFRKQQKQMNGSQLPREGSLPNSAPTPGNVKSAAQFSILVHRLTANIAEALPIPVFAPIYAPNGWRRFVQGYLGAGTVLTSVRYGENQSQPDSARFTFTNGVNVDIVDVSCSSAPYPVFLDSLITDMFEVNKIRMTLSDPAQVRQFAQELTFQTRTLFGLGGTNPVTPDNFRSPQQYQAGIVDVDVDAKFDKQTGVIVPIVDEADFEVSLNMYAPRFYQQSARGW